SNTPQNSWPSTGSPTWWWFSLRAANRWACCRRSTSRACSPGARRESLGSDYASRSATGGFVSTACRLRVGCEEVGLVGEHDRLDAVTQAQLLEDVRDVRLDRGVADVELLADLRVGQAARDQAQHVQFTIGQLGQLLGRLRVRDARELLDHALCDRRR